MLKFRVLFGLIAVSSALAIPVLAQEVPADLPSTHWAYDAVADLAKKNLIKGYPPDGKFLGNRQMTRYEFATILKRLLDRMDEIVKKPDTNNGDDYKKLKASYDEIKSLVDEFKIQLTVIGTDMAKVKEEIDSLKGQFKELSDKVSGFDSRINAIAKKADDTAAIGDATLESLNEYKNTNNAALAKKVDINTGKIRVSGLFQSWYGAPISGDTLGGNTGGNFGTVPPGRNFGGGVGDTFRIRRGEISFIGNITPKADYRVMFDVAKTGTANNSVLQEIWAGYNLTPRLRFEVGQQKTQLSEEGTRSSSQLLTVERSIMNGLPTSAGRVGDIRENGAVLRYVAPAGSIVLGVWNDNGANLNGVDTNRSKFGTATAYFTGIRRFTLGVWGGANFGDFQPRDIRDRVGATLKYESGRHIAEAEFAYGVDRTGTPAPFNANRARSMGGYAFYGYSMSPTWQFVGRYDEWDPAIHGGTAAGVVIAPTKHNAREYTVGVNYFILKHNAKIQANYIVDDIAHGGFNFFGIRRQSVLLNFQSAF